MALLTRNVFLVALGVIGTYGTWGRCFQDGTLRYILTAVFSDKQPFLLPGTDGEPLIKNMTGIWPLDRLLAVLVLFFWQAADGSHPTTSAVGLYFAAQHLGLVVNMHLGSLTGRSKLNPTLWTLLFQALAIGTAGPLYAFLHLSTAAAAAATTPRLNAASTTRAIRSLPLACLLGYVLPALLMALRGHGFKQHAIAAWNVFPVWILLVQRLVQLPTLLLLSPSSSSSSSSSSSFQSSSRAVYVATILVTAAAHVATVALTAAAALFPMAFAPGYAAALRPGRVFVPPVAPAAAPSSAATTATTAATTGIITAGEGVRGFMLWDQAVGYAVVLFLAVDGLLGSWGVGREEEEEEEEESERIRHPRSVGITQPKMDVKAAAAAAAAAAVDDVGEIRKGRAAVRRPHAAAVAAAAAERRRRWRLVGRDGRAWLVTGGAALLGAVLVGPAAAVLGLQWAADELAWKTVKEKKKRTGHLIATGPREGRADQGR